MSFNMDEEIRKIQKRLSQELSNSLLGITNEVEYKHPTREEIDARDLKTWEEAKADGILLDIECFTSKKLNDLYIEAYFDTTPSDFDFNITALVSPDFKRFEIITFNCDHYFYSNDLDDKVKEEMTEIAIELLKKSKLRLITKGLI